jgi:hypothetical protein
MLSKILMSLNFTCRNAGLGFTAISTRWSCEPFACSPICSRSQACTIVALRSSASPGVFIELEPAHHRGVSYHNVAFGVFSNPSISFSPDGQMLDTHRREYIASFQITFDALSNLSNSQLHRSLPTEHMESPERNIVHRGFEERWKEQRAVWKEKKA